MRTAGNGSGNVQDRLRKRSGRGDHAARNATTGAARGIGRVIIAAGVHHDRRAVRVEKCVLPPDRYAGQPELETQHTSGRRVDDRQIAQVRTMLVEEAVLVAAWIEMAARR